MGPILQTSILFLSRTKRDEKNSKKFKYVVQKLDHTCVIFRLQRDSEFPVELVQWAEVCILVYAVDDRRSFETARRLLQRLTHQRAAAPNNEKPVFALIGNKADLEHLRTVSSHSFAIRNQFIFNKISVYGVFLDHFFTSQTNQKIKIVRKMNHALADFISFC
jgi:hypothetical protein